MAKVLKFGLMLDNCNVRSLEGLQEHFVIEDVLKYFEDGTLSRWLKVWGYKEQLAAVEAIEKTLDKKDIVLQLANIFGIEDVDAADIEKVFFTAEEAAYEYLAGYEALITNMRKKINLYLEDNEFFESGDKVFVICKILSDELQKMRKDYIGLLSKPLWLASSFCFLIDLKSITSITSYDMISRQFILFFIIILLVMDNNDDDELNFLDSFDTFQSHLRLSSALKSINSIEPIALKSIESIEPIIKSSSDVPEFFVRVLVLVKIKVDILIAMSTMSKTWGVLIKENTKFKQKAIQKGLAAFEADLQNFALQGIIPKISLKFRELELTFAYLVTILLSSSDENVFMNIVELIMEIGANKNNEQ